MASTTPAPSAPGICGNGTPGIPSRTKMSRWFMAAARIATRTSPSRGSGVSRSPYSRTSLPPCFWKKTAFMRPPCEVAVSGSPPREFAAPDAAPPGVVGSSRREPPALLDAGDGHGATEKEALAVRDVQGAQCLQFLFILD